MKNKKKFYKQRYGINQAVLNMFIFKNGFNVHKRGNNLKKIKKNFFSYMNTKVQKEDLIKKTTNTNIEKKIKTGSYPGYCHLMGLPVKGQRTHNNRKTQRRLSKKRLLSILA